MTFDEWWLQNKPAECDELKPWFIECWQEAEKEERESCGKVAEEFGDWRDSRGTDVAAAIRARGNP